MIAPNINLAARIIKAGHDRKPTYSDSRSNVHYCRVGYARRIKPVLMKTLMRLLMKPLAIPLCHQETVTKRLVIAI